MDNCVKSRKIVLLKDRILLPVLYKEVFLRKNKRGNISPIVTSLDVPDDWGIELVRKENSELVYPVSLDIVEVDEYHLILRNKKSVVIINYYYGEGFRKVVALNKVTFFETCFSYGDRFQELKENKRNKMIELTNNVVCFYRAGNKEKIVYLE